MSHSTLCAGESQLAFDDRDGLALVVRDASDEVLARFDLDPSELRGVLEGRYAFQAVDAGGVLVGLEANASGLKARFQVPGQPLRICRFDADEAKTFVPPLELVYNCSGERMKTRTILVVEDDANDEKLTLRALRGVRSPCSVVVARSGSDALDYLLCRGDFADRHSPDPDAMFLDNSLPGIPGAELVRQIRAADALREVPVVVFSGTSNQEIIDGCLAAGANAFVEKPVDMDDYLAALRATAERWLSAG